jgi:hypothetical protein
MPANNPSAYQPQMPIPNPSDSGNSFAEPFFKNAYQEAFRQFNQGGPQFFGGPTVAGFSPQQLDSQRQLQGQVAPQLQQLGQMQLGGLQRQFDIGQGNAPMNPISSELQASITNPIMRDLQAQHSAIGSGAVQSGAFGGSRQQLLNDQASLGAGQRLQDSLATATLNKQGQEANILQNAQGQANDVRQGLVAAPSLLGGVGGQQQNLNQQLIDASRQRFDFGQNSQQQQLAKLFGFLGGRPDFGNPNAGSTPASGLSSGLADATDAYNLFNLISG